MNPPLRLLARWLVPSANEILEGAAITIENGRIAAIEKSPVGSAIDLGNVTLTPGFVNAHTHLDLSSARAALQPPGSFVDWLDSVVAHRRQHVIEANRQAIQQAIEAILASGTTMVGDIAGSPTSLEVSASSPLRVIHFLEVLGRRPDRYEPLWESAMDVLGSAESASISPHAPYSTHPEIYRRASELPPTRPIATHWFESCEELEFLQTGEGPMRRFLERVGAVGPGESIPARSKDAIWRDFLEPGRARWLLVHGNHLDADDLERLATDAWRSRVSAVVYCPRTHAYFGHPPHPWKELRRRGIPVALGTDSLASNPDLNVHEEARFLRRADPSCDPRSLLEMVTSAGSVALGRSDSLGTLDVGKWGDLAIWKTSAQVPNEVVEALFADDAHCVASLKGGDWVKSDVFLSFGR